MAKQNKSANVNSLDMKFVGIPRYCTSAKGSENCKVSVSQYKFFFDEDLKPAFPGNPCSRIAQYFVYEFYLVTRIINTLTTICDFLIFRDPANLSQLTLTLPNSQASDPN